MAPVGDSRRTALRVTAGPAVGRLILVDEELRIGSSADGDGSLGGDPSLDELHALLTRDHAGEWMVRDLGSADGTFLNGQPLTAIEPIHRGDTLRVGKTRLLVVEGPARPPAKRAAVPVAPPLAEASRLAFEAPEPALSPPPVEAPVLPARPRLEDRIASYRTRALAALIDNLIASAIVAGSIVAFDLSLFSVLLGIGLVLIWDFLFESLRGQTIGKRVMKIRVVRRDGTRLRPQHVAARNGLRLLDLYAGMQLVGLLSMILSGPSRRQRLGDLAAGTIVVKSGREMSRLPDNARDRLVLAGYPVLWLTPVIAFALLAPSATWKPCRQEVISATNPPETTCMTRTDLGPTLLTIVNPGHTLAWRGGQIRLLATRARAVRRTFGFATVVALKLSVRNAGSQPLRFDAHTVRLVLNIPDGRGDVRSGLELSPHIHLGGFRALVTRRTIPPGHTRVGWARFAVPSSAVPLLNTHLGSISFFPVAFGSVPRVGNIRLWNPATPQGARASRVVFQ